MDHGQVFRLAERGGNIQRMVQADIGRHHFTDQGIHRCGSYGVKHVCDFLFVGTDVPVLEMFPFDHVLFLSVKTECKNNQ